MNHCRRIIVWTAVFAPYAVVFLDGTVVQRLTREDGPIENLGAVFFFLAAAVFFRLCLLRPTGQAETTESPAWFRRKKFYLLLGVLFLVSFGEEISWGQRLFNWETPQLMSEWNAQNETNIHNLWVINLQEPGERQRAIMGIQLNVNAYFSLFWLLFCVVVPLLDRSITGFHNFTDRIGLPIVPLWLGGLFLAHAVFFHLFFNYLPNLPGRLDELRETIYAFLFLVFSIHEWRQATEQLLVERRTRTCRRPGQAGRQR